MMKKEHKKKLKKAQVTLFIILALIIVASIIAFFILMQRAPTEKEVIIPQQVLPIADSIQDCVKTELEEGTKLAALQGGYVLPPSNALETENFYTAYWYFNKNKISPSKEIIGSQISQYIELNLPLCFPNLQTQQFSITTQSPKALTTIENNTVKTSVSFSFTATRDNSTYQINKKYTSEYQVNLGNMYYIANNIIEKELEDEKSIDMSYLSNFPYQISISYYGNNVIIYSIEQELKGEAFILRFANRLQ